MEHFFSPNSGGRLRSDAHQSQIIGGNANVDHTQTIGGIQSNYWGDISTPSHMLTFSKTEKVRVNLLTSNSTTFA